MGRQNQKYTAGTQNRELNTQTRYGTQWSFLRNQMWAKQFSLYIAQNLNVSEFKGKTTEFPTIELKTNNKCKTKTTMFYQRFF